MCFGVSASWHKGMLDLRAEGPLRMYQFGKRCSSIDD